VRRATTVHKCHFPGCVGRYVTARGLREHVARCHPLSSAAAANDAMLRGMLLSARTPSTVPVPGSCESAAASLSVSAAAKPRAAVVSTAEAQVAAARRWLDSAPPPSNFNFGF
jgi:hypothetical protein